MWLWLEKRDASVGTIFRMYTCKNQHFDHNILAQKDCNHHLEIKSPTVFSEKCVSVIYNIPQLLLPQPLKCCSSFWILICFFLCNLLVFKMNIILSMGIMSLCVSKLQIQNLAENTEVSVEPLGKNYSPEYWLRCLVSDLLIQRTDIYQPFDVTHW